MSTRAEVYQALDGERAYQDERWGPRTDQYSAQNERVADFVLYMEDYLARAKDALVNQPDPQAQEAALHMIRKVTALGVACMEVNGAPRREGY